MPPEAQTLTPEIEALVSSHSEGPWESERGYVPPERGKQDVAVGEPAKEPEVQADAATPPKQEKPSEPEKPPEQEKPDDKTARSLALIARKESALHKRERELKAATEQLQSRLAELEKDRKSFDEVRSKEYDDPVQLLADHGFTVDHAVHAKLQREGVDVPKEVSSRVQQELAQRKDKREQSAAEKRLEALERRLEEQAKAEQERSAAESKARAEAALSAAQRGAHDYVTAHADKYPALALAADVFGINVGAALTEIYRKQLNETGRALTLDEAASYYESEWSPKLARYRASTGQTTPHDTQSQAREKPTPQRTAKTLSNDDAAERTTRTSTKTLAEEFETNRAEALRALREGIRD